MVARAVEEYVGKVVDRLHGILGNDLAAVYAVGSLALGGFVLGRSDVDLLAVTAMAPADAVKRRIVEALTHPRLECPTRGLEFVLYERATVASASPGAAFEINLNTGPQMELRWSFDPAQEPAHWFVIDRSIARSSGISLYSPNPTDTIDEIPRPWLLRALLDMLAWHRSNEASGENIVLNACRSWRFVEEAIWSSKVEGAAWAKGRGADPLPIDAALARRAGDDSFEIPESRVDGLVRHVEQAIATALEGD